MSVKSDRWIRKMASEEGMIEPFEPGQIKEVNGERVVSFGTSSYGYDIRCSGEFKIFTNINSTIVDPKNFDSGSFVDFQGDVCIIPPNSSSVPVSPVIPSPATSAEVIIPLLSSIKIAAVGSSMNFWFLKL